MTTPAQSIELFSGTLPIAYTDAGKGRTFLVLHGGAGPGSVMGLAQALSIDARAIVPTHPGFDGQPRPERFARVDDLVLAYLAFIDELDLTNVVVVGNSLGGWIASELALRGSPRIAATVLVNAVGIAGKVADPMSVAPAERASMAFHDPARFALTPSSPEALAVMAQNQRTLRVYASEPFMHDPTLCARLRETATPTLVLWGASDRVVDVDYGRAFASSIPSSRFELVEKAGHFPQIERLEEVLRLIADFTRGFDSSTKIHASRSVQVDVGG